MNAIDEMIDALESGDLNNLANAIRKGALEAQGEGGWTPLFYGVATGDIRAVKMMLEAGANSYHMDNKGWSASMLAAFEGKMQIARLIEGAKSFA